MNIGDFPTEILFKIFSYLKPNELCLHVSPVCRKWHQLSYDPLLWKNLKLDLYYHKRKDVIRLLKFSIHLTSLCLTNVHDWRWLNRLPQRKNITELELVRCSFSNEIELLQLVKRFPCIQIFIRTLNTKEYEISFKHISRWKWLKKINISISSKDLIFIAKHCEHLEDITIQNEQIPALITDKEFIGFTKYCKTTLKALWIHCIYLTDISYKSLTTCTRLTELYLDIPVMRIAGLMALGELQCLRELYINFAQIRTRDFTRFFKASKLPNLDALSFRNCKLTDKALHHLPKCCPNLTCFYLENGDEETDKVTDVGLNSVALGCRKLKYVALRRITKLTGSCFHNFSPCLESLSFYFSKMILKQYVDDLINQRTNIEISCNGKILTQGQNN